MFIVLRGTTFICTINVHHNSSIKATKGTEESGRCGEEGVSCDNFCLSWGSIFEKMLRVVCKYYHIQNISIKQSQAETETTEGRAVWIKFPDLFKKRGFD